MTNLKEVNFLDATFNLENRTFFPYKKPTINYCISTSHPTILQKSSSNFPTQSIKDNSSDEAAFNSTKVEYEDALKKSDYKVNLKYTDKTTAKPKRNRQKNTKWFNPLFNKSVKTNVAKIFFRLLDKHFSRTNRLYKIFNHNTVKVSYSFKENVRQIIKNTRAMLTGKSPIRNHQATAERRMIAQLTIFAE